MTETSIYKDIETRTGGDIYIGVVGPVRTGKSTFIKRFMDTLVIPNISEEHRRERAQDELPQSAAGRTIMTTEPKFIPEQAVKVGLPNNAELNVRLIDCVGYIVPSSLGYVEEDKPRMVKTPWYDHEIPFNMAAEIGTQKVITEHSTIGLVITTDGSISDIPRDEYEEAEERVINELKEINKPFVVLLNSVSPKADSTVILASDLSLKYGVPVIPVNCLDVDEEDIRDILSAMLFRFPIKEIGIEMPGWVMGLGYEHWLRKSVCSCVKESASYLRCLGDVAKLVGDICENEYVLKAEISCLDLGKGCAQIYTELSKELIYKVIDEKTALKISNEQELMDCICDLASIKKKYDKIKNALDEVEATGYGIVMPDIDELTLKEPEIVKQGGRYGVRLGASAPSIHMLKTCIETEVAPVVGTESQSEELLKYLLTGFEEDPHKIWESDIFGKSLNELVNEGLRNKLCHMPVDARAKIQETLERIINDGCSGLICIIL
ncbi:MAG: stage IV sporulation protein A [Ruminococcaceae bacterium]|nr:stage IV sporulation protein A [Oscillospiraceae bacterium]